MFLLCSWPAAAAVPLMSGSRMHEPPAEKWKLEPKVLERTAHFFSARVSLLFPGLSSRFNI
jgi:hypothetical protein